ncbi:MAG TPA: MerR family DNA-binding transcriptional regulator [Jiangellales bacterium]|nr:MerR family DNA-binding transcriptional regulator [Jiangellales bacterium]
MTSESVSTRERGDVEDARTWSIAEIARDFGVTLRTVRFYEEHGLIFPERRGQQRVFHPRDRVRLALVLRGRRLGFPLEEIKKIVDMYDAEPGESGQLRYLLAQIGDRRQELEHRRRDLDEALAELDELERRCRDDLTRLT